jgi:hypothetical protein
MIVSRSWPTNIRPFGKCSVTVIGRTRNIIICRLSKIICGCLLAGNSGLAQPGNSPSGTPSIKKKPEEGVVGRCDSFVVETVVHFPTDINLLLDAIRKVIEISAELSETHNLPGWRQHHYHQRLFKRQYRRVQRFKHSTSKDALEVHDWTNVPITDSTVLSATLPWRWSHVTDSVWGRCCGSRNKRLLNENEDLTRRQPEKSRLIRMQSRWKSYARLA